MAETLASGHTSEEIKEEEGERLKDKYFMYTDGAVKLHPGGWVLPAKFIKFANLIYNFEVKPTDVFVLGFPKSGTMWMQEIAWNLIHNPNLDNPGAETNLVQRSPILESDIFVSNIGTFSEDPNKELVKKFQMLYPGRHYSEGIYVLLAAHLPSPRMFKSHLAFSLLPSKLLESKVIFIARDPRDVITSYYYFTQLQILMGFKGTLDEFVDDVVNDRVPFTPYWEHLKSAWDQRNHPNFCLVFYEDLKTDTVSEIKRIDKFLGTNRSETQIQNIVHYTSFAEMKKRNNLYKTELRGKLLHREVKKEGGGFFRKGETSDWKNKFSPEQTEKVNAWMAKNLLHFGENFKYKI